MRSEGHTQDRCLDPTLLAAFVEKKLTRVEIAEVLAHLDRCPRCRSAVEAAVELQEPERDNRWWLLVAATLAILAGTATLVRRSVVSSPTEGLVRLAPRSARLVEPRLSGGFAWAPFHGPARSTDGDSEGRRMKLVGAAGDLVERAETERSAEAQHAAGIGLVLVERPEDAMARLHAATERAPADAQSWSDLAAAEYMTALRLGRASLYPIALAHADRALRIDPHFKEALFNRALILERLGLKQPARMAWNRYLAADHSSAWAKEARERLQKLDARTGDSLFQEELPRLENAAIHDDRATVEAIVDRHRQQSRTYAEAEFLGRWADALLRGDSDEAQRPLDVARAIGDALVELSEESLLYDAVAAIDRAPPPQRTTIARAHSSYRRGRLTYSRGQPMSAERDLRDAAAQFESAGDPMSLVARYYAANTRFDQNDVTAARRALESLREVADSNSGYRALGAQIRWELGLCAMLDGDWSAAARLASEAEQTFAQLGEKSNRAFMQTMLATALISMGRADDGWDLRRLAFETQSGEGRADRLLVTVDDAACVELRTGRLDSARALLDVVAAAHRRSGDHAQLSNALVRETLIGTMLADVSASARTSGEAMLAAQAIQDAGLRARAEADAKFAAGAVALSRDANRARQSLSQAIDYYRATEKPFYLPEALLLRARASLRIGKPDEALLDLEHGLDEIDRHRSVVSGRVVGTGVLNARRAMWEELVALRLDRKDLAGAFAAAERAHDRLTLDADSNGPGVAALQKKLEGSDTAVLEIVALPNEIVAFCVTARGLVVSRRTMERRAAMELATRGQNDPSPELYDLFIRPVEASLMRQRQLIIIVDEALPNIPFAALFDATTHRYLVERMTVATALSADTLQPSRGEAPLPTVVAMELPSGERSGTVALPEQSAELADLGRLYGNILKLAGDRATLSALTDPALRAGVIHIAGHTQRQSGPGDPALLFRGKGQGVEPVTWSRIASMTLGQPIVVLAACDTLRVPSFARTHALSLGGGFLAAGATSVIGTLAPVPDRDARDIFRVVHLALSQGESAAVALRRAHLEAIERERHGHRSAWRAVALLTSRIERG